MAEADSLKIRFLPIPPGQAVEGVLLLALAVWMAWPPAGDGIENDASWVATLLAGAFVLFMHLPVVWRKEPDGTGCGIGFRSLTAGMFLAGGLAGLLSLQALGWGLALRAWAMRNLQQAGLPVSRSWLAALFVFPWISNDLPVVGWLFRLSGAVISERFFAVLGYPVYREGTLLLVGGLPVSIDAACAGLGLLQSLFVTGILLILLFFPRGPGFWLLLPGVPVLAWVANTARILLLTAVAMSEGVEFTQGIFHTWGGLLAIALMLALSIPLLFALRGAFASHSAGKSG